MPELTREQFIKIMTQSLKQQVIAAIKRGDKEAALALVRGLNNPQPPKIIKPSGVDQPYRLSFVYKKQ
jgi:hypothetical protein